MANDNIYDTIIIGSGPAGYTAAIYLSRANCSVLLLSGDQPGGQLTITTDIENFPGFKNGVLGPILMKDMEEQAKRFGTEIIYKKATAVNFKKQPFEILSDEKAYYAKTCIIATGASAKWLGLESEKRLRGKGISGCATCDGFFFKGKNVIVVGGGDVAMEEAIFLTKFAQNVTVFVRRDKLRASAYLAGMAVKNPKIKIVYNTEVKEFIGGQMLEKIKIFNQKNNKEKIIEAHGAFIAIGHEPNTAIFKGAIELDDFGYAVRKINSQSSIEGVFLAGDVHDPHYRQAVTAAGYGCEAATDAQRYLEEKKSAAGK